MKVEVIRDAAAFLSLRTDWEAITRASRDPYPFSSFAWTRTWWEQMPRRTGFVQRHALFVLVAREHGTAVAIMPMLETTYLPWLGRGIRYLAPLGSDANITELKTIVCLPGYERQAIAAFDAALHDKDASWDFCQWPDVPQELADAISMVRRPRATLEAFTLPLTESFGELQASRKRNVKEAIRKCRNAPARAGVDLDFTVLRDRAAVLAALPDFYRLHGMRAASSSGPVHLDYFASRKHQRFLERLVAEADGFETCLLIVRHGDAVVAARLGFVVNDALYLYFSGYDLAYGAYSVATRLVVEAIQDAFGRGLRLLHLSTGRDRSKTRWSADVTAYLRPLVVRSGLRSRALADAFHWLKA